LRATLAVPFRETVGGAPDTEDGSLICSTAIRRAHKREILLTRRSASRRSRMVMSKGIAVPSLPTVVPAPVSL
jgi:hypothetical protein